MKRRCCPVRAAKQNFIEELEARQIPEDLIDWARVHVSAKLVKYPSKREVHFFVSKNPQRMHRSKKSLVAWLQRQQSAALLNMFGSEDESDEEEAAEAAEAAGDDEESDVDIMN